MTLMEMNKLIFNYFGGLIVLLVQMIGYYNKCYVNDHETCHE